MLQTGDFAFDTANGANVQSVLDQDARFISDAVKKNIKTTEQAIEWYNQERLKIQDAFNSLQNRMRLL